MVWQVTSEYEVKDLLLKKYNELVTKQWGNFSKVQIEQISREKKYKGRWVIPTRPLRSKNNSRNLGWTLKLAQRYKKVDDNGYWRSQLEKSYHWVLESPLADTDSSSVKLRIKAARYILINEVLYKKSFTLPYLWCLGSDKVEYTLRKIHEGIYGQHIGSWSLAHKELKIRVLLAHYEKNAANFVSKCDKCQKFTKTAHQPIE